jgi:hypothetical protein
MNHLRLKRKKPKYEFANTQDGAPLPVAPDNGPRDLWDEAYTALRNDKDSRKTYEILRKDPYVAS